MKKLIKNKKFQILFILLVVVLLVLLCFFNRIDEDVVTRVSKVLGYKYYKIECINEKCDYVVAYKGDKKGKTEIRIINSNGKTVVKYKEDYSSSEYKRVPVAATTNYAILAKKDSKDYVHGYIAINSRGKELINTETEILVSLTDKYYYGKTDDLYTVYDYDGNILYQDVKDLILYNDGNIITFVNNELNIINKKSERILEGYEIIEEVKDEDNTLYLIIKDQNGVFYYFDIEKEKIIGDSFDSYIIMPDNELLVTKKTNNELKKYLLTTEGRISKEIDMNSDIVEKIEKKVNGNYTVVDETIKNIVQKSVIVINNDDNSYGIYELETGNYSKLNNFNNTNPDKNLSIYSLCEDLDNVYLEIGCSKTYCDEENIIVYNPITNNISYNSIGIEKEIKKYREYSNGYKVITYTDKSYSLFDRDNKEIVFSKNNIIVLGEKIIIDDETSKSNVLIYSSKENKLVNDDTTLAILDESSNYKIYKIYDEDNLYLYNDSGVYIKKVPIESSSVSFGDKYMLYFENNKAKIFNLMNNKSTSLDLTTKQFIIDSNDTIIPPYKGAVIITDTNDNTVKVFNYNKKMIKKIKNSKVESVGFDEENNKIFLITKQDKNYGLFIIK